MKTSGMTLAVLLLLSTLHASTTVDSVNRYAYAANLGWLDWRADSTNGAVIGAYICSGYLYSPNVGWINLGSGSPANRIRYQNLSANDFGVNQDGLGNLSGYAWGADIGWLNFTNTGAPKINLLTGDFSGYVWSANCGWISLSNTVAHIQTDAISPGTLDTNDLPVAWELTWFGQTGLNPAADPTGKGMTLLQDYLAGTDPNNPDSLLRITSEGISPGGTNASLTWASVPTRLYTIQKTLGLAPSAWTDSGLGLISPSGESFTTAGFTDTNAPLRFYRVQAIRPLAP